MSNEFYNTQFQFNRVYNSTLFLLLLKKTSFSRTINDVFNHSLAHFFPRKNINTNKKREKEI